MRCIFPRTLIVICFLLSLPAVPQDTSVVRIGVSLPRTAPNTVAGDEGFRRTADAPEYLYVLGFSPPKLDGKFHKLKVRLNTGAKLTVQAREGYYALRPAATP